MRLASVEVAGFRGFTSRQSFDLDADSIVLIGANGQGKTSLFDAILWCLAGRIQRFPGDDKLLSLYSDTGTMYVGLTLKDLNNSITVRRSFDGVKQRITLHDGNDSFEGPRAQEQLLRQLWPGAGFQRNSASLESALVNGVYLQQDRLRAFIEAEDESSRFAAISELIGAGRLNDLQVQLDNARSAWNKATNVKTVEIEGLRKRLATLESQLAGLAATAPDASAMDDRWKQWWMFPEVSALWKGPVPAPSGPDASNAVDQSLKQLQATRVARDRRIANAEALLNEIVRHRALPVAPDVESLRMRHLDLLSRINQASKNLSHAREAAAEERKRQVVVGTAKEELKALAQLAIRHLGEHCPVCDQTYDREATLRRLHAFLSEEVRPFGIQTATVEEAASHLAAVEKGLAGIERELRETEQQTVDAENWNGERQKRLQDLSLDELPETDVTRLLSDFIGNLKTENATIRKLEQEGEALALLLGRAGEEARKYELQRETEQLRMRLTETDSALESRNRTAEQATRILDCLRDAASDIVEAEISRLEPLLQRIYARVDPHPSFRVVRLLSRFANRRGRVSVSVEDPISGIGSDEPIAVLSSSQLNSLALSLFLSLNLGVGALPLDAALLDDPLQTLDNVNLLGVIDLLRRAKGLRQLVISTHDERFGRLLERKLRPVSGEQSTRVFELEGWTRQGPLVRRYDAEVDTKPLKIAV
jgi:DNA repair exonuclease SbcCD ATPase subunit